MQANQRYIYPLRSRRKCSMTDGKVQQELLPGILDEITLIKISPKLAWRDFYILATVSHVWCDAIRSRQVYNARVRDNSTEALVLVNGIKKKKKKKYVDRSNAIGVYSMGDNSLRYLPPIPSVKGGFPIYCQSVALDGKVYVLGGGDECNGSAEVYVLDLARQIKWKRCADMIIDRVSSGFGCGVMDGKIYVFGDQSLRLEEYDPSENTWSVIADQRKSLLKPPDVDSFAVLWAEVQQMRFQLLCNTGMGAFQKRSRIEIAGNELLRVHEDEFEYLPYAEEVDDYKRRGTRRR